MKKLINKVVVQNWLDGISDSQLRKMVEELAAKKGTVFVEPKKIEEALHYRKWLSYDIEVEGGLYYTSERDCYIHYILNLVHLKKMKPRELVSVIVAARKAA